jgi:rubrerythrin
MSKIIKPSHEEEEYFTQVEIDKRRALAEKLKSQMAAEELQKLKALHWMHCPKCGFEMHSIVFKGVSIEECPHCGGIYLDASEVKQLMGEEGGFISSVLGLFKFEE